MGAAHPDKAQVHTALSSVWASVSRGNLLSKSKLGELVTEVNYKLPIDTETALTFLKAHIIKPSATLAELEKLLEENWSPADLSANIRKQVEYYLSDANLRHDKFFYDLISCNELGYVTIEVLLKCRKLKNLTSSVETVALALKNSTEVELSTDGSSVRRFNNSPLPQLESAKKSQRGEAKSEAPIIILKVALPEETKSTWKELRDSFKAAFIDVDLTYTRFHDQEGHIGVAGNTPASSVEAIVSNGFRLDSQQAVVAKIEGDELLLFWKKHGTHFELCSQQAKRNRDNKKSLTFGGKSFPSQAKFKTYIKSLLSSTREGDLVDPQYYHFLLGLLKLHPHYEEKVLGLKQFGVNRHPEHTEQKCFFVVKEDGSWVDFSAAKCISQI